MPHRQGQSRGEAAVIDRIKRAKARRAQVDAAAPSANRDRALERLDAEIAAQERTLARQRAFSAGARTPEQILGREPVTQGDARRRRRRRS